MKKKTTFTAIATAALSAVMCLGFTACGEDKENGDTVITYEVASAEWSQIMDKTVSFTIEDYSLKAGSEGKRWISKIDGDKFELNGTEHQIIAKVDEKYYVYTDLKSNQGWIREDYSSEYGEMTLNSYRFPQYFKEEYSKFTYSDGAYTAAKIENSKTEAMGMAIENVKISFKNGSVTGMEFEIDERKYEIKNVGTTIIELPSNYTEESEDD